MKSTANPVAQFSDTSRMGMTGHSLGSAVTSYLQGEPDVGIDAIVATDNLRRFLQGDPGGSNQECSEARTGEVTPLVPALGMAKDEPCNSAPQETSPDIKLFGWNWWRDNQLPTMELVMRGFVHGDFSGQGQETKKRDIAHFSGAWFDRWLGIDDSNERLLARTVNGRPTSEVLSTSYYSGACLPGDVDTARFETWIAAEPVKPDPKAACDTSVTPPVTPPVNPPGSPVSEAKLRYLKASTARRIKAGRRATLRISIRNTGGKPAVRVRVRISSTNRKVRVRKRIAFARVRPSGIARLNTRIRVNRKARGKARITVRAAGMKRAVNLRILR